MSARHTKLAVCAAALIGAAAAVGVRATEAEPPQLDAQRAVSVFMSVCWSNRLDPTAQVNTATAEPLALSFKRVLFSTVRIYGGDGITVWVEGRTGNAHCMVMTEAPDELAWETYAYGFGAALGIGAPKLSRAGKSYYADWKHGLPADVRAVQAELSTANHTVWLKLHGKKP